MQLKSGPPQRELTCGLSFTFLTTSVASSFWAMVHALSLPRNVICTVRNAPVNSPIVLVLADATKSSGMLVLRVFRCTSWLQLRVVVECLFMTTCDGRRPLHRVCFLCRNLGSNIILMSVFVVMWLAKFIGIADPIMMAVFGVYCLVSVTMDLMSEALNELSRLLQLAGAVIMMQLVFASVLAVLAAVRRLKLVACRKREVLVLRIGDLWWPSRLMWCVLTLSITIVPP